MSNPLKNSWKHLKTSVPFVRAESDTCRNAAAPLSVSEMKVLESLPGAVCVFDANAETVWMNSECDALVGADEINRFSCVPEGCVETVADLKLAAVIDAVCAEGVPKTCNVNSCCTGQPDSNRHYQFRLSRYVSSDVACETPLVLALVSESVQPESSPREFSTDGETLRSQVNALTKLLATTSHEMRTPLNAIIGFAEMLEGRAGRVLEPVKQAEYSRLISTTARQMLEMTGELIDLSKLHSGHRELRIEAINIAKLADDVLVSLQPILGKNSVTTDLNIGENLPDVMADARSLRQVLINLVSNACKFSDAGSDIAIEMSRSFRSVNVAITDHGHGITPEALQKLGTEYFREGVNSSLEGSGLGLSIVYRLLDQMDGKLSVSSKPGKGSTFTITLPIAFSSAKPIPSHPDNDVVYLKSQAASQAHGSASIPMTKTKQKLAQ